MRKVTKSTSWLTRLLRKSGGNAGDVNELLASPMNRWSYSTPNDQFGVEAVLKSNTDGGAPAGRVCRGQFSAENVLEDAKAVARHRRAALYVKQRLIPGVADLAGKEADAIGLECAWRTEDR